MAVNADQPAGPPPGVLAVNELADHTTQTVDLPTPSVALAVGAHPDDIEFGAGGTLAKWAAAGCRIHHLVLTDGAKGTWDTERDPASLVAARQEEQREAAQRLGGGEVAFLGFPDGELRNGVREQWEVCRCIRLIRPDVVLGHDPWRRYRLHPDHRNAGFVLTDSLVAARDPMFFGDQDLPSHRPVELLLWEADVANHVEAVDGFGEHKVRALLAHRSQYPSTMGFEPPADGSDPTGPAVDAFRDGVVQQLVEHGRVGSVELGEAFHRIAKL